MITCCRFYWNCRYCCYSCLVLLLIEVVPILGQSEISLNVKICFPLTLQGKVILTTTYALLMEAIASAAPISLPREPANYDEVSMQQSMVFSDSLKVFFSQFSDSDWIRN